MSVFYNILIIVFIVIQLVAALYLLIPFFSVVLYGLIKLFRVKSPYLRKPVLYNKHFDFGIIITAHQEVEFIKPLVDSILRQNYQEYCIYVVADDCDITTLQFADVRVKVLRPQPALHAKIKSIEYAREHFERPHEVTMIFDSDNLLHPGFLQVINSHFQKGYKVVQADFKPKNEDTLYARIDAIGDMYNFFVDREIRMMAGLSSAIWGSGVAFESSLYNEISYKTMVGGFDKKLQSSLLLQAKKMAFSTEAILYDEKVETGGSLENQRARWMLSYFNYFDESKKVLLTGIKTLNVDFIYFGFVLLKPPQLMLFGGIFLCLIANFFILPVLNYVWAGIILSFILSFATIIYIRSRNLAYIRALFTLPVFLFRMALGIFKLKKATKSFIKTPHTKVVYIEEVLARQNK